MYAIFRPLFAPALVRLFESVECQCVVSFRCFIGGECLLSTLFYGLYDENNTDFNVFVSNIENAFVCEKLFRVISLNDLKPI